jgi:deazaflavin-dependent oxidoreductase (nitroreductase family)
VANSRKEIDPDRLIGDAHAIDELNQGVITQFRANQGRVFIDRANRVVLSSTDGMPILLLTMTGAKTRRTLTRPLCYGRDGDRIVILASYGGAPGNPPWYYNLIANPLVTVEVGTEKFKARATEASGAERQRLFDAQARLMPLFSDYQKKTRRQIPVLTLTRVD